MAATLTDKRFTGPEWIFERKLDGIRLLGFKKGRSVELFSRNRLPQHNAAIADAIANLPHRELILDGEVTGIWGPASTREADRPRGYAYHVFDILWIDGKDVTPLPLDERRALLKTLPLQSPLRRVTALLRLIRAAWRDAWDHVEDRYGWP